MKTDKSQWLSITDVSKRLGITPSTWSSYVSRGHAPKPDWQIDRKPLWKKQTIEKWESNRPGQGSRKKN